MVRQVSTYRYIPRYCTEYLASIWIGKLWQLWQTIIRHSTTCHYTPRFSTHPHNKPWKSKIKQYSEHQAFNLHTFGQVTKWSPLMCLTWQVQCETPCYYKPWHKTRQATSTTRNTTHLSHGTRHHATHHNKWCQCTMSWQRYSTWSLNVTRNNNTKFSIETVRLLF